MSSQRWPISSRRKTWKANNLRFALTSPNRQLQQPHFRQSSCQYCSTFKWTKNDMCWHFVLLTKKFSGSPRVEETGSEFSWCTLHILLVHLLQGLQGTCQFFTCQKNTRLLFEHISMLACLRIVRIWARTYLLLWSSSPRLGSTEADGWGSPFIEAEVGRTGRCGTFAQLLSPPLIMNCS